MSHVKKFSKLTGNNRSDRFRPIVHAGPILLSLLMPLLAMTPGEYLSAQTKPVFRQGNTLLPLARCGWPGTTYEMGKKLADYWGFTLPLTPWISSDDTSLSWGFKASMTDPNNTDYKYLHLAAANPQKYKLHAYIDRALPSYQECPQCYCHAADGSPINGGSVWSPEAPDSVLRVYAKKRAVSFRRIKAIAPVFIASNMGEYGLGVPGSRDNFAQDTMVNNRAAGDWWGYISKRKAHQELILDSLVKLELAQGGNYYYYANGGSVDRNRYGGWGDWCWVIEYMKDISPYSSEQSYYLDFNSGFIGPSIPQTTNMLVGRLNAKGWEIAMGKPLSYDWVCAGWGRGRGPVDFANIPLWTGYLKCMYTAGMIGANVGFYQFVRDDAPFDSTVDSLSHWVYQLMAQGRAQALFSWVDPFLRTGDLLPGPAVNPYSTDHPAYEFPVANDDSAHILARKLTNQNRWIITAWAAAGASRMVSATIPTLGTVSVRARAAGSVYHARLNGTSAVLTMLDRDSLCVTFDTTTLKAQLGDLYGTAAAFLSPAPARTHAMNFSSDLASQGYFVDMRGRLFTRANKNGLHALQSGIYFPIGKSTKSTGARTIVWFK